MAGQYHPTFMNNSDTRRLLSLINEIRGRTNDNAIWSALDELEREVRYPLASSAPSLPPNFGQMNNPYAQNIKKINNPYANGLGSTSTTTSGTQPQPWTATPGTQQAPPKKKLWGGGVSPNKGSIDAAEKELERTLLNEMKWACDVCGKKRNNADISVLTYAMSAGSVVTKNLKYCNDNLSCFKGAKEKEIEEGYTRAAGAHDTDAGALYIASGGTYHGKLSGLSEYIA